MHYWVFLFAVQRNQLATLFDESARIIVNQHINGTSSSDWFTRILWTQQEIRRLHIEGKDALIPNLPRPTF